MPKYLPTVSGKVLVAALALAIVWTPQSVAADRMVLGEGFVNTG